MPPPWFLEFLVRKENTFTLTSIQGHNILHTVHVCTVYIMSFNIYCTCSNKPNSLISPRLEVEIFNKPLLSNKPPYPPPPSTKKP